MSTIVLGVIGADCHAVGNKILDYGLTEAGHNVVNIGVLSSQEEFINAAIETNADVIMVSSLYGHAELDCYGFKDKYNEAGLHALLYIGGNLTVGKQAFNEVEIKFKALGFDRVFPPGSELNMIIDILEADMERLTPVGRGTVLKTVSR